jgi:RNA polymerase sigma-70 factor (ECF subfamily)
MSDAYVAVLELLLHGPPPGELSMKYVQYAPSASARSNDANCGVSSDDDFTLLERWRDGDGISGARLYQRHAPGVARFFVSRASEAAEDLIQQTFLATLEALPHFRRDASFRSFLFSVARNQLHNYYRNRDAYRSRHEAHGSNESTEANAQRYQTSPSRALSNARQQVMLLETLSHLPVDLRMALELHFWEGLTIPEVAAVMGVPLNTGYSRLRRAKELLRERLGRS